MCRRALLCAAIFAPSVLGQASSGAWSSELDSGYGDGQEQVISDTLPPGLHPFPTFDEVEREDPAMARGLVLPEGPKHHEIIKPIIGGWCGKGFYRAASVLWSCESPQSQNRFAVEGGKKLPVFEVPRGTRNLRIQINSIGAHVLLEVKAKGAKAPIVGSNASRALVSPLNSFDIWEDVGITLQGGGGTETVTFEGTLPAALLVSLDNSRGKDEVPATVIVSHKGLSACPPRESPIGCQPYNREHAGDEVNAWACWAAAKFSPREAAWSAFGRSGDEAGAGIPWFQFGMVWDHFRTTEGETKWLSAFKYLDTDENMHISRDEFLAGLTLCPTAPLPPHKNHGVDDVRAIHHGDSRSTDEAAGVMTANAMVWVVGLAVALGITMLVMNSLAKSSRSYALMSNEEGSKGYEVDPESQLGAKSQQDMTQRACAGPSLWSRFECAGWREKAPICAGGASGGGTEPSSAAAPAPVLAPSPPPPPVFKRPPWQAKHEPKLRSSGSQRPSPMPSSAPSVAAGAAVSDVRADMLPTDAIDTAARRVRAREEAAARLAAANAAEVAASGAPQLRGAQSSPQESPQTRHAAPSGSLSFSPPITTTLAKDSAVPGLTLNFSMDGAAAMCPEEGGHAMEFRKGAYNLYECNRCRAENVGERWHCGTHQRDVCPGCGPPTAPATSAPHLLDDETPLELLGRALKALGGDEEAALGCRMLTAAVSEDDMKLEALKQGAANAVVKAMHSDKNDDVLQYLGCTALRALCAGSDVEPAAATTGAGGVQAVLDAMKHHPSSVNVQDAGCRALRQLALSSAGRTALRRCDGSQALLAALAGHEHSPGVQAGGCLALGNLATEPGALDADIASGGEFGLRREAVVAVIRGMARHEESASVQEAGLFALYNFICTAEALDQVKALGGVEAARKAMRRHPKLEEMDEAVVIAEEADEEEQETTILEASQERTQLASLIGLVPGGH